jgi:hypothetical protein
LTQIYAPTWGSYSIPIPYQILFYAECGSPAKSGHEPAGVMNRFCLVNPLDGKREAPDSKRMESAAMAWR